MTAPLAQAFLEALDPTLRAAFDDELESELVALCERADVEPLRFVRYLAERVDPRAASPEGLRALHVEDLALACACFDGDERAAKRLGEEHAAAMRGSVERLADAELADEVVQRVLARLLVADDGPPDIGRYSGRGSLRAWAQTVAVREARTLLRQRGRRRRDSLTMLVDGALASSQEAAPDPQLERLKARYRADFKRAFAEAFEQLEERQRNVLRYAFIDGLSIDAIASIYRVGRSTAARWRNAARDELLEATRARFSHEAQIAPEDCDSILRLIRSQLDISLP